MNISNELIDHLSHLARLQFDHEQKDRIRTDLGKIIGFCEKLNEMDTQGVEPLIYMTDDVNVLREDIPGETLSKEEALMNAPKRDSDYFRIPKVVENKG